MEWLAIAVFLIFIVGLGIVTIDAINHARKSSSSKPTK